MTSLLRRLYNVVLQRCTTWHGGAGSVKPRSRNGRDVRIAPEGVFVAGRKVVSLQQVLVRVPKADVLAISRVRGGTGSRVGAGAVGGFFGFMGGAILGGIVGGKIGQAAGVDPSNLSPMLFGLLGGGVTGGYFGYRAAAGPRGEEALIYQAPAATPP